MVVLMTMHKLTNFILKSVLLFIAVKEKETVCFDIICWEVCCFGIQHELHMDCADKEFCYIDNNMINCYDVCFFLLLHDSPI